MTMGDNNDSSKPPSLVGMSKDPKECLDIYEPWAEKYDDDVDRWGYNMPETVANMLAKHVSCPAEASVLDAGAGSGLSGVALLKAGFCHVDANDISPKMLEIAKTRNCYKNVEVVDMNQFPLPYRNDSFDVVACVGATTYLEPSILDQFVRIAKPGSFVIYTLRTDKEEEWIKAEQLQREWSGVEISDPLPYLPHNDEFADKVLVTVRLFRVKKFRRSSLFNSGAGVWDAASLAAAVQKP